MRPIVSVIIPVRDRRDLLVACLEALSRQTYAPFEVIVVDDGSVDGSDKAAEEYDLGGRRVAVLRQTGPDRGAVRARQAGVAASAGAILAFTDSDCVPAPDWLERGVAAIEAGNAVVQGRTEPTRHRAPLERSLWVGRDDGLFPTCNVLYRRDAFDRAGGFDMTAARTLGFRLGSKAKGLGMGEDTLLGWRVRRAEPAVFAPDVCVHHHVFPADPGDTLGRRLQAGAFPALVREVPELRDTLLTRRLFLGTSHIPLYGATLLLATRHRRLASAAAAVWVGRHWQGLVRTEPRPRQRLAALPWLLAFDAVEAVALLAGSVQARTLVL